KQLAAGDKQKALKLAEEKVLPYIDFEESTRLAVGRAWSQATPEQRKKLVGEFRNMLVRTYSNSIEAYQGQTMKVMPSRGAKGEGKGRVAVARAVRRRGRKAVADRVPDAQGRPELEGLRHRRGRNQPGAALSQRIRRRGEAGRHRWADQAPSTEEQPRQAR